MDPFRHIQHRGQRNLHTDHASSSLNLPKKKKQNILLINWELSLLCGKQSLIMYDSRPSEWWSAVEPIAYNWIAGTYIFHSPKASATNTRSNIYIYILLQFRSGLTRF
jgi:hypothetical protein